MESSKSGFSYRYNSSMSSFKYVFIQLISLPLSKVRVESVGKSPIGLVHVLLQCFVGHNKKERSRENEWEWETVHVNRARICRRKRGVAKEESGYGVASLAGTDGLSRSRRASGRGSRS